VGVGKHAYHRPASGHATLHRLQLYQIGNRVGAGPHGFVESAIEA